MRLMRLTAAFAAHELRVQRRSLRFRAFAAGYLALGCLPAAFIHFRRPVLDYTIGGASYAAETLSVLPLLTALLAGLLSLDGIGRERTGGAWTTASLTGLSSTGYLIRRWLALLALVLPLSAAPPLFAAVLAIVDGGSGAARIAGIAGIAPGAFFGPWLLHVVPVALAVSALALGLGTIGASAASTFVLAILTFGVLPAVGNQILDPFGLQFGPPQAWLDLQPAASVARRVANTFDTKNRWFWTFPLPDTEAGFDAGTEAEQDLAEGLLLLSLAAAVLGASAFYLRRTRPDVRPQRVRPDHPLRTFLVMLGRLREQSKPDPAPAPADYAFLALALVLAAGAVALEIGRAHHYETIAAERSQAETGTGPAPTPTDVLPGRWRIEGQVKDNGRVDLRVTAELRNTGATPRGHLAFSLNPSLDANLDRERGGRIVHAWDRLTVDLDHPIPPGGRRTLRFHLTGRPGEPRFALPHLYDFQHNPFSEAYRRHHLARFGHDRSDLSRSYQVPAVSGDRVALTAPALTPVPRYTAWSLNDAGTVTEDTFAPPAQIELALQVPRGVFLADGCGGISDPAGRSGRLDSRCALAFPELQVAGGRQRRLPGGAGGATVAVYPAHRGLGELHLGFLARGSRLLDEAWPGLGGLERLVLLEWPGDDVHDRHRLSTLYGRYRDPLSSWVAVYGQLAFLQEVDLIDLRDLAPERLVAEIVASRLASRRRLAPEDSFFFRQLFRSLALQRLGLGPQMGAVVPLVSPEQLPAIRTPALHANAGSGYWYLRFPALVAALGKRTGAEPLRAAVDELLSASPDGDRPATFAEFAALLARHSEGPVEPMIRDFFRAGAIPELTLEDVSFQPAGNGWRVSGRVHNLADGEALCRVVLTTDLGPVETTVRTGAAATAAFVLATPHHPQGVVLDPDRECHRLVPKTGTADRVYFQAGRK